MSIPEESLDAVIELQIVLGQRIKTNYENLKRTGIDKRTKAFLKTKSKEFESNWLKFDSDHRDIFISTPAAKRKINQYLISGLYEEVHETQRKAELKLETWLEEIQVQAPPLAPNITFPSNLSIQQQPTIVHSLKLPPIDIEPFTGDYHKWPAFKSLFLNLVHNKTEISKVEKLHHLLSRLKGEPKRIISHYSLTEENYSVAWEAIIHRYDNKRILVNTELKLLINQINITHESANHLKAFLDQTNECLNALTNLDIDIKSWDSILVYILAQKIDSQSRTHWEASLTDPRAVPTLKAFLTFIESRFRCLEGIDSESSSHNQYKNKFTSNETNYNNYQQSKGNNFQHSKSNNVQNHQHSRQNSSNHFNSSRNPNSNHQNQFNRASNQNFNQNSNQNRFLKPQSSRYSQFESNRSCFLAEVEHVCPICNNDHNIFNCNSFINKTTAQRKANVLSLNLCTNCLGKHDTDTCGSSKRCKECRHRHHTLLHNTNSNSSLNASANPFSINNNASNNTTSSHFVKESSTQVLLATAIVPVVSENGEQHFLRCLLDQGSQSSFITEAAVQLLKLQRTPIIVTITGLSSSKPETSKHLVTFNMASRYDTNFQTPIDALVLSKITGHLPTSFIPKNNHWDHLSDLFLADADYGIPNKIDILLGADIYSKIIMDGLRKGSIGSPIAQQTKLGWIISGKVWNNQCNHHQHRQVQSLHLRTDIDKALTKFWEIEEIPTIRSLTADEIECEQIFNETHRRDSSGRFIVALPFKQDRKELGKSKYRASQRLAQLKSKFSKNASYKERYTEVINEYINSHHMIPSTSVNSDRESYYLPHHAVIKETSTTTKMRVVFDASAITTSGESLNEQLHVGPTIQQDLASILLRWRKHKISLSADVTKMYRQVWIRDEDKRFHKVLWSNENLERDMEYELQTVTFGTASAAYLAIKSLQQLAHYESKKYPIASEVVLQDFYVDDLLTGTDSISEAIQLQNDISSLLSSGGFELRKWISNNDVVMQQIPNEHREISFPLSFESSNTTKTLGMHYHPAIDAFQFKVQLQSAIKAPTKRTLLSDTARLFDPLGWLAPVIIKAKILLQRVWQAGYDWDHQLTGDIKDDWFKYRSELHQLENLQIPRWFGKESRNGKIQLHGFCDASESAYAAVVYIKIINHENQSTVTMLSSKTKVAPLQVISIPRLELCSAVLLAKLLTFVKNALAIEVDDIWAWTDSEIVLAWLRGNPSRWKTFVANRVVNIIQHTNNNQWRHIASQENPADCASRGIFPSELKDHLLWWYGPKWLKNGKPENAVHQEFDTTLEMKEKIITVQHVNTSHELISKYSSINKLLRIIAKAQRFIYNCRYPLNKRLGFLTSIEYIEAMNKCIKMVQQNEFFDEIYKIKSNGQCHKNSKLLPLNPFVDKNGILRVGGRLKHADLAFDQKHQIIIPSGSHFANLIINDAHIRSEHGGTQITLSIIRNKFWIINGRNTIKKFIHNCITCHRYRKCANEQLMGSLPQSRLQVDRAFNRVGVDYCGPFDIKASRLRGAKKYKGYIALFICLSSKAVHIEVVSELSTEAFLAAFHRFVGRRGLPSDMHSDNGTNFVGADRDLKRSIKESINFNHVFIKAAEKGIKWHFIPPRSPHFGGLWEAAIKSLKKHLVRIIGSTALTFEELSTVVIKIESVLNSRPLTPLSDDPDDFLPLTPGHFLIGTELLAPPTHDLSSKNINCLTRWKLLNKLHQDFWKRWQNEYLNTLQRRNKWKQIRKESKVGDLVLLRDENLPPNKWSLARIVNVIPGGDGHVRVVTVKTPSGSIFKRAIAKIHPLPINTDEE